MCFFIQIANVNNCQTFANFLTRMSKDYGKDSNVDARQFEVVAEQFSAVNKDSIALYL